MVQLAESDSTVMSSSTGFPTLYPGQQQQLMGSIHNIPRGLGQALHSQGLQGRITPTQFGNRPGSNLGMNFMGNNSASRNPLFSRKMGEGPASFDPSDFPSLAPGVGSGIGGMPGRPNYVGMVKQPTDHSSDFQMSNEDFPALPGAPPSGHGSSGSIMDSLKMPVMTPEQELKHQQQARKGIQTSPDGMVTNIPSTMVVDQFGMIGLLTFIRAAETDPNLVSLALGTDLTTLGLNLNSEVTLFPTFGGPWADTPCRPQDIDFHVPHEYLTNTTIRDKLAPVKLNRYKDDILFFMFYTNVGDVLQMAAAAELHNRDWRYHKEERLWITRAPGMVPLEKTQTYERGTYYFFDVSTWRKVPKEFHLDYDKLEDRPSLASAPPGSGPSPGPTGGSPGPIGPQNTQQGGL
ncbi:CCR4-NOT transcription complex subunit 2 [Eurytemora carolleeae]|uniref:CCR4-NOT transcription complex subunit 2 n=1 Tax=Eurytemora carolleeae TaxID=1294199 RepID=UPI000C77BA27|nr:CCR4-NOT transcription complex subunit 2 [Eurytemora carolleeae]|eukprot:XP_023333121.1 CCR4-NOT transcription complex subunit 2-like [Eurytemora affinis]